MIATLPKPKVNPSLVPPAEDPSDPFWQASACAALSGLLGGAHLGELEAVRRAITCADLMTQAKTLYQPPVPEGNLVPTSLSAAAIGGANNTFEVNTNGNPAEWLPSSGESWITVTSPTTPETGDSGVVFNVAANGGAARSGTIAISGLNLSFTVNQASAIGG